METSQTGNNIRVERERAGITLKFLSERTAIPLSTLSRYQNGAEVPISALQRIADVLNIPVSALLIQRQIPEDGKLTYDQICLQLQATQQRNVIGAIRYESLRRAYRWALVLVIVLLVFLGCILVDRFAFPYDGFFHAGR